MNEHKHFFVCLCVCLSVVASLVDVCVFWRCVCVCLWPQTQTVEEK